MSSGDSGSQHSVEPPRLAPRWHTAALIALIVSVAATGLALSSRSGGPGGAAQDSRIVGAYLPLIVVQAGLVLYVARVGRRRSRLASLVGERWSTLRRAAVDVAIAAVGFLFVHAVETVWSAALGAVQNAPVSGLLPCSVPERLVWVVVACAVGFGEEVVYRGYLTAQLTAFSRSVIAGVALQALLFGLAHADQGLGAAVRLTLYGVAFGVVARARKSLLPVILCHVAIDLASGLLHS